LDPRKLKKQLEELLTLNKATLLYRQIHPSWLQGERVTSQAFKPTPKDKKKLSLYDGDIVSAESSWKHFTMKQELLSIGCLAVTVEECSNQELDVEPDPETFPSHVLLNFEKHSGNQIEKKAKKLRVSALARGWQFYVQ
jgi:hypothetical protein